MLVYVDILWIYNLIEYKYTICHNIEKNIHVYVCIM